jgi:AcrR family transcriptional regulator
MPANRPVQARSRLRVERILEAAAEEIIRSGAGGFSMNAVAKRTKISPGSLYQFFPSREALIAALYERYIEGLRSIASQAASTLSKQCALTVSEIVRAFLVPSLAFYRAHPAYAELHHALNRPYAPDLRETELDNGIVAALSDAFKRLAPETEPSLLLLLATVTLEAAHAILSLCASKPAEEAQALSGELEVMLETYVQVRLKVGK